MYAGIVETGIYTNDGPLERKFTAGLGAWLGLDAAHVAVVSSGTMAVRLAMAATLRHDRQFVLVPSFTHPAGPLMIKDLGYEPTFVDIGPSWQPSLSSARGFLIDHTNEAAGILLTNSFGAANPEIDEWEALADEHQIPLVIDSAAGFGSEHSSGERLGLRGECEAFSFHATKLLAIGEGGCVTSRSTAVIEEIQRLKNFGYDDSKRSVALGTNAKLGELEAGIGLLQLAVLPERLARRQAIQLTYEELLSPSGLTFQPLADRSAVPFVSALFPTSRARDRALARLTDAGVACRAYYNQLVHHQPFFVGTRVATTLDITEQLASRILSLPMADSLTRTDIEFIADIADRVTGAS